MIRVQVSAVFQVRDGFTGRVVEGSNLVCRLDGVPVRPVCKPGGYLVLTNLPAGIHTMTFSSAGYQQEQVEFSVKDGSTCEIYVALKPSRQYLFRQSVIRLQLQVPPACRGVWISTPGAPECKVAQTKAEAGADTFRIYCKGLPSQLPVPGEFLIEDGENSEIVLLQSLSEETAQLAAPLCREHSRSRRILPVQKYRPDASGEIYAAFARAGTAVFYREGSAPESAELSEGENQIELQK